MEIFETVSFHIVKPCNMQCKFCYATFDDMHVKQMDFLDAFKIIEKLAKAGVKKITFAGGEPLLYKSLLSCVYYAKKLGMTTSIITNGSLLTDEWLKAFKNQLDWIGLSIDSTNPKTNYDTGRFVGGKYFTSFTDYKRLIKQIKAFGYNLKINTVVNAYNKDEDLNKLISNTKPDRWKVFQALRIEGQNDTQFDEIKVSNEEYNNFLERHKNQSSLVPENNEAMTGSYLLIDPQGRFFENTEGKHTYSRSIITNTVEDCLSDIKLNREMFIKRGGIYEW